MEVIKAKPWYTFGPLKARVEEVSTLDLELIPCNSPPCTALDTQTRKEHTFSSSVSQTTLRRLPLT